MGNQPTEPPIIDLNEVRRRRRSEHSLDTGNDPDARANRVRHLRQMRLLRELLLHKRLRQEDLLDMVTLGIISSDEALLPCRASSRKESFRKWEEGHYGGKPEGGYGTLDPDADLIDELQEQFLALGHEDFARRVRGSLLVSVPDPNLVGCPLLARTAHDAKAPCIEALRLRSEAEFDVRTGRLTFQPVPIEETDPVVVECLRPCVVLGRELFRTLCPGPHPG